MSKDGFPPWRETEGVKEKIEYGNRQTTGSCEKSKKRYAHELRKKDTRSDRLKDELVEERVKVNQQQMKTPGRRGEEIKQEEIERNC